MEFALRINKNIFKQWWLGIVVYFSISTAFASVDIDEPQLKQPIQNSTQTLVLGVEDLHYFPLFDFKNTHPTFTTELFEEFGKQFGYKFEFYPMPVKRFDKWLFEKDIDLKFPDNSRWNESEEVNRLSKVITYSKPVLHLVAGTITYNKNIKHKNDVKILGTLLGFYPTKWINEINSGQVELYESSSTLMLVQQLIRGQLDAINLEPTVVNHYLNQIREKEFVNINKNIDYEVYSYHLSSIKYPNVISDFNQFLVDNSEYVEGLRKKYKITDHKEYLVN